MKLAVLSDVHGNVPALEAVLEDIIAWGADRIVVNGDLVNRGPCSESCLRLLHEEVPSCVFVQGNHEEFVLYCGDGAEHQGPKFELRRFAHWTFRQLGSYAKEIAKWPDHIDLIDPAEGVVHITHGSRLGKREGIGPDTAESDLEAKLGSHRGLFIASHTHKPLVREFGDSLVVNVGSVGSPFDGDPRAAYGRFSFRAGKWKAEIMRVAFDRARTERDYSESGFLHEAGPLARLMLAEFRQSRGHMGPWMRKYHDAVLEGDTSVAAAVEEYLAQIQAEEVSNYFV